jgi:hypothetical protein
MQFPGRNAKPGFFGKEEAAEIMRGGALCPEGLTIRSMTSITIKLPEELKEKLETEARMRGKSRSALVRDSLEKAWLGPGGLRGGNRACWI